MSDFEMVFLFSDYMNLVFTVFMGHASLVFAFLIASYLVAAKLETRMVTIVISLFTIACGLTIFVQNRFGGAMVGIGSEMRKAVESGTSSIGWHSVTYEPGYYVQGFMNVLGFLMLLSYVAALVFFFYQRNVNKRSS